MWSHLFIICLFPILIHKSNQNSYHQRTHKSKPPIILVPGFSGSKLYLCSKNVNKKYDDCYNGIYRHYWINIWGMYSIDPVEWLSLEYDNISHTMVDRKGYIVKPGKFGKVSAVEHPGEIFASVMRIYFEYLIYMLESIGYKVDYNIKGAPYDFRKLPLEPYLSMYNDNLTKLIEELYNQHGKNCIIISHSMGGSLIRQFLHTKSQKWKDKYILSWISMGGTFAGTYTASLIHYPGYDGQVFESIFGKKALMQFTPTFPSLYYLYPSRKYFNNDKIMYKTPYNIYTLKNVSNLLRKNIGPIYDVITKNLTIPDIWINGSVGVSLHCVYGDGVPTLGSVTIGMNNSFDLSQQSYVNGDGTATKEELESCLQLINDNQKSNNSVRIFHKIDHVNILSEELPLDWLKSLLLPFI